MIEKEADWIGPRVFFDISIGGKDMGRITIELRPDISPKSSENFRQLCTGEYRPRGLPFGYKNSIFHRVIPGFIIQGGDIENRDGSGNTSIYGQSFEDEPSAYEFNSSGIVACANSGQNTNGCQFFITLNECMNLNGKYIAFGKVIDGMRTVRSIEAVPINLDTDKPVLEISVKECGEL